MSWYARSSAELGSNWGKVLIRKFNLGDALLSFSCLEAFAAFLNFLAKKKCFIQLMLCYLLINVSYYTYFNLDIVKQQ